MLHTEPTHAKKKDVTKFLDIPIDGSKEKMIQRLTEKGFELNITDGIEYMLGNYEGTRVRIFIKTERGSVWRLGICEENFVSATEIRQRFNFLCQIFRNNERYAHSSEGYTISGNEDIEDGIANGKEYSACFFQLPEGMTETQFMDSLLMDALGEYNLDKTEPISSEEREKIAAAASKAMREYLRDRVVWFQIEKFKDKYYIALFYDNKHNHPDVKQ